MKSLRWLTMMFSLTLLAAACGGDEQAIVLPDKHTIARGSNLYEATAALCGTNATDEAGRGRWRRWLRDPELAKAPLRQSKNWGTIAVIQPGTYDVPRDLCADEAGFPWLAALLGAAGLLAGILVVRAVWRETKRDDPASSEYGFSSTM